MSVIRRSEDRILWPEGFWIRRSRGLLDDQNVRGFNHLRFDRRIFHDHGFVMVVCLCSLHSLTALLF